MKPIRTRVEILEAGDAAHKDVRKMSDAELEAEFARLRPICAALPPDPEIDAEIERLTRKLYPTTDHQDTRGTTNAQAN
ncbi:hypothetical protein [uncultured Thiodictyon sp.]|uniref:hypothetical protein n=1 Tax=uncultured Thiodictyon sp. TaxID=1846217 RepID=UPI0025FE0F49|nr:hypothetical protein [uncultured Thiodictyon sp.]